MPEDLKFNGWLAERDNAHMLSAPPVRHQAVTLGGGDVSFDAADPPRVLFIGGTGDVTVEDMNGDAETYTVAAAPYELAGFFTKIVAATTDATKIIARW
ncbi:hypothetical protein EOI86_07140 [Hwanghaeella grinnelliae]|uniref:Uncharacterized protein n=1 Tax=Hwanghaeella grinnelliae TaxID=2500179 RepID=A0A3S2Y5I1_9PROT|nr:hypothetical protein [Hwanghaeella grinnelliae]RVU39025.1 hypothetical protein EOI86_07140 [Hwanghaeella grinnelliae]